MELKIVQAISRGLNKSFTRNGAKIAILMAFTSILSKIFTDSTVLKLERSIQSGSSYNSVPISTSYPLAIDIPVLPSSIFLLASTVLGVIVTIGAIRTFLQSRERPFYPQFFTQNIIWPTFHLGVGGLVFSGIVLAGWMAFFIPGIFLFVSLFYWYFYVIEKNMNLIEAMIEAWNDTKGNRIRTLALIILVSVLIGMFGSIISIIFSYIGGAIAGYAGEALAQVTVSAFLSVIGLSIFTEAYLMISAHPKKNQRRN